MLWPSAILSYGTKHLHYEVAGGYCHREDGYRYGERSVTVVHTISGINTDAPYTPPADGHQTPLLTAVKTITHSPLFLP